MRKHAILLMVIFMTTAASYAQTTCDTATVYATTGANAVCIDPAMNSNTVRGIFSNSYPDAAYTSFTFGNGAASAAVTEEDVELYICKNPQPGSYFIPITTSGTAGANGNLTCPGYSFGVAVNGIYISPNSGVVYTDDNGVEYDEWQIEALESTLGWDENDAHKQSSGRYHYHGNPSDYATNLGYNNSSQHSGIIAWAADGYPVYYKYGYSDPSDNTSSIVELTSCWGLRSGDRSTLGYADYPSGSFDGTYELDYQYPKSGTSASNCDLDSANGRWAVTPQFPMGTYHYVITTDWPYVPRYFKGTPDVSFRTGPSSCQNTTAFSDCGSMPYNASQHLPVELIAFEGQPKENYNLIEWKTASEKNSSHFELERSIDGRDFEQLEIIESSHFTSSSKSYSFYDFDLTETVYYYRLKMVDYDGAYEYSEIINVVNGLSKANIGDFQPNIVDDLSLLPIQLTLPQTAQIQVISSVGQVVKSVNYDLDAGYHTLDVDFHDLQPQIYFVAVEIGKEKVVRKVVKK